MTSLLEMQAIEAIVVDNSTLMELINLAPVFEEEIPLSVAYEVKGSETFDYSIPSIIDLENESFKI